jgi:hypothetical protein
VTRNRVYTPEGLCNSDNLFLRYRYFKVVTSLQQFLSFTFHEYKMNQTMVYLLLLVCLNTDTHINILSEFETIHTSFDF